LTIFYQKITIAAILSTFFGFPCIIHIVLDIF